MIGGDDDTIGLSESFRVKDRLAGRAAPAPHLDPDRAPRAFGIALAHEPLPRAGVVTGQAHRDA